MRADRLLKIMLLLQNKGKLTTRQLAAIVEVSERTILRDMDALTLAGIPVIAERGKGGGWKLMDHFQSDIGDLHLEVLKALFILPSESVLEALNISASGTMIRQSLLAKLPAAAKHDAKQYFDKIHIDDTTWKSAQPTASTMLHELQLALWEDRKLKITYQKSNGECSERIVSPLGLVSKGRSWYVVALNEQGEYRNFKVSRIVQLQQETVTFIRPQGFNLSQYWEQSKSKFVETLPVVEVRVLAHRSILSRLGLSGKFLSKIELVGADDIGTADDIGAAYIPADGSTDQPAERTMVPVVLHFNSEQEAVEYVLGFGTLMRLLQPDHLIPHIVEQAKAVIQQYKES